MKESKFLTEEQEKILKEYGYVPTLIGESLEVWKVNGDDCMIDVWKDENGVSCQMWISSEEAKRFSPKRIKSFLKKSLRF